MISEQIRVIVLLKTALNRLLIIGKEFLLPALTHEEDKQFLLC